MDRSTRQRIPIIRKTYLFSQFVNTLIDTSIYIRIVALKKVRLENEKEGFPITAVSVSLLMTINEMSINENY